VITSEHEYEAAKSELVDLEDRLGRLLSERPGEKGLVKAGLRKLIARLHEELALYEGGLAIKDPEMTPT
jgi:hypothetical protein